MARRGSLQTRLLGIAAVSCLMAWLAGGTAVYLAVQREDARLFDARLQDLAYTLAVFAGHELREIRIDGLPVPVVLETDATRHDRYRYQIWSHDGRLLMASANALHGRRLLPAGQDGLHTLAIDGQHYRAVALDAEAGNYQIQAAEPVSERLESMDLFGAYLAGGMMLSAVALGLLTLLLLRVAMRPLRQAVTQIEQRGPLDLRPLDVHAALPRELEPALAAINSLLRRIDVALRSERGFVSAAAHELRTPLAGLRAQAELAQHPSTAAAERAAALRSVMDGVDHATYLVNQLLDLARSDMLAGDPTRLDEDRVEVDWAAVLEAVLAELGPQAAARGLRLEHRFDAPTVSGSAFGIGLIVRNLLANAIAHARAGGEVQLGTAVSPTTVTLTVDDDGPGIAPAQRERAFERFRRSAGAAPPGCGLGLSIVKAVADAHGATVALGESPLGGLRATLRFPRH